MSPAVRSLAVAAIVAAAAAAAGIGAVGWHLARRIHDEALLPSHDRIGRATYDDVLIVAVGDSTLTMTPLGDERRRLPRPGRWGLVWEGGSGSVDSIVGRDGERVTRRYHAFDTRPARGQRADLRLEAFPPSPLRALGLPYRQVAIGTELGAMPAWVVPGPRDVWVICVHGKGAARDQMLRGLEVYAALGCPILVCSYRNDSDAPASPDGRYHYGATEWRDLEAAVRRARSRGARRVVLHGVSMGGGIVAAFLQRSTLAPYVAGAVLDSPMLDFGETIDWGVAQSRLPVVGAPPPAAAAIGKEIAALRDGIDWKALDFLPGMDSVRVPILVLHGDDDHVVPVTTSVALAARLPDRVTLVRFPRADHGEGWNVDRGRFESSIHDFVARIAP